MITKFARLGRLLPTPLYKLLAQRWVDYKMPRHLFIETTTKCNLACGYCPRPQIEEEMSYELFQEVIDQMSDRPRSFSLHLFGEPLLTTWLIRGIRYIKQKVRGHTILITTNGTLLNDFARELLAYRTDRLIWTLRPHNFTADTKRILKRIGIIRVIKETAPEGWEKEWKGYRQEVKSLHNYGDSIKLQHRPLEPRYPCYHLWLAPAIRWNGDFTICCCDSQGSKVIGNLRHSTIKDIWQGFALLRERQDHLQGNYTGICKRCDTWQTYPSIW